MNENFCFLDFYDGNDTFSVIAEHNLRFSTMINQRKFSQALTIFGGWPYKGPGEFGTTAEDNQLIEKWKSNWYVRNGPGSFTEAIEDYNEYYQDIPSDLQIITQQPCDVRELLDNLADQRLAFENENDLRFEFALLTQRKYPSAQVRLEKTITGTQNIKGKQDLAISYNGQKSIIEFKYKTSKQIISDYDGTQITLIQQGGHNSANYAICKDIIRLEHIVQANPNTTGYLIFITNTPSFWNPPTNKHTTIDQQFRLTDRRTLTGTLSEQRPPDQMTLYPDLTMQGSYEVRWWNYSQDEQSNKELRYVVIEVNRWNIQLQQLKQQMPD